VGKNGPDCGQRPAQRLAVSNVFLGTHTHNLDAKGRLAIPARFRDGLGAESVLTRSADQCLECQIQKSGAEPRFEGVDRPAP